MYKREWSFHPSSIQERRDHSSKVPHQTNKEDITVCVALRMREIQTACKWNNSQNLRMSGMVMHWYWCSLHVRWKRETKRNTVWVSYYTFFFEGDRREQILYKFCLSPHTGYRSLSLSFSDHPLPGIGLMSWVLWRKQASSPFCRDKLVMTTYLRGFWGTFIFCKSFT